MTLSSPFDTDLDDEALERWTQDMALRTEAFIASLIATGINPTVIFAGVHRAAITGGAQVWGNAWAAEQCEQMARRFRAADQSGDQSSGATSLAMAATKGRA